MAAPAFRARVVAVAVALTVLTGGCVSKRKYDAMKRERDVYASHYATLTEESLALADVALTLGEELTIREQEVAQLRQTQAQIEHELEALVAAGLIRIKLLRDGLHVVLAEEVLFGSGSAELNERGREVLANMVDELTEFPYQIGVLGYTDSIPVGSRLAERYPSNWELAGARAASVARLLEGAGVPGEQLAVVSFGPNRPFASNETPEGRAQNRRIELRLRPA
jgi:chemotaxis protein MotB